MKPKRYVLLQAHGDVPEPGWEELGTHLEARFGKLKRIPIRGNTRFLVLKTDDRVARLIRAESATMSVGGSRVVTVLTSGSIGKLKRRVRNGGATEVGKVPE